jgi:hypothetical protein
VKNSDDDNDKTTMEDIQINSGEDCGGDEGKKRNFTSAIPGMSVTDMRRCLSEVRFLLHASSDKPNNPFDLKSCLSNGMEVWKFVHMVAIGLHLKRSYNRKKSPQIKK